MPRRGASGTIVRMTHAELDVAPAARELREHAAASAQRAADLAGVAVRPLETLPELDAGSQLITRIWDDGGDAKAPTSLLRALIHAGNFVAGAFQDDRLAGISVGFWGRHGAEFHLHSHITGVDRALHGRSLGFVLKQFQRSWALERGARTILWTADPLVRGNAFFNLAKLGATMVAYHQNFYGVLEDGLNAGESDRVVLHWDLVSDRVVRAADGGFEEGSVSDGCIVLRAGANGEPETRAAEGEVLLAWIPEDIVRIREEDPQRASAWLRALRETAGVALGAGFRAEAITRDGWLVLAR